jgi:hypothetical protein
MPPGDDVIATLDVSSTSPRKSQTDGEGAAKSIVGGVKTSMEVKLYINSHKTNTVSSSDLLYKPVGLL